MSRLLFGCVLTFGGVGGVCYGFTWFAYWARPRRVSHTRWLLGSMLDTWRNLR